MATNQATNPVQQALTGKPTSVQTSTTRRKVSASQRRAEIVIAVLFLLTAAVSIVGGSLLAPMLEAKNYLSLVYPNKAAVQLDTLLISINNVGIVFIAVFAFPLLRKLDEALATAYLATRIIESTLMMLGIFATLLLIPLSQEFIAAGAVQNPMLVAIGETLKHLRLLVQDKILVFLALGGCFFTWLLFRYRLVPRWMGGFGLFSYVLILLAGLVSWFDVVSVSLGGNGFLLAMPVAFFEIILLPFWLFFRGFNLDPST